MGRTGRVHIATGLAVGHDAVCEVRGSFYAELFGTRLRYSEASMGRGVSGTFGGALVPIVATALYPVGGTALVSAYVAALCVLSVVFYALAEETFQDINTDEEEKLGLFAEQQGRA